MFLLLFLNYWLLFLIPDDTTQMFNTTAEPLILTGIPAKQGKAEMEIHPAIVESKIDKCSI